MTARSAGADEIVADNIRAAGAIYAAWQLEELRLFDVVDRLVERFRHGMLPIRDASGAEALEQYYRDRDERLTRQARFALHARVLGAPAGDSEQAASNRDFDGLWRRLLSAVADHDDKRRLATRSGAQSPSIPRDPVRSAARRLAANATTAVSSVSELAVQHLIDQAQQALEILKTPEILSAYAVQSPWKIIDRVAASELAAAVPDIARHRTMGDAGRATLDLVAANPDWSLTEDTERVASDIHPDLMRHAERWLKAARS